MGSSPGACPWLRSIPEKPERGEDGRAEGYLLSPSGMRRFYKANAPSREKAERCLGGSLRACTLAGLGSQFAALKLQRQWGAAPQRSLFPPDLVRWTRRARGSLSLRARGSGGRHPSAQATPPPPSRLHPSRHWLPSQRIQRFRASANARAVWLLSLCSLPLQELGRLGVGLPGPRRLVVSLVSSLRRLFPVPSIFPPP